MYFNSYLGIVRFTVPMGKISIDFPQNLFFHLTSEKQVESVLQLRHGEQYLKIKI